MAEGMFEIKNIIGLTTHVYAADLIQCLAENSINVIGLNVKTIITLRKCFLKRGIDLNLLTSVDIEAFFEDGPTAA